MRDFVDPNAQGHVAEIRQPEGEGIEHPATQPLMNWKNRAYARTAAISIAPRCASRESRRRGADAASGRDGKVGTGWWAPAPTAKI